MMKKNYLILLILSFQLSAVYAQKLCGENITVAAEKNSDSYTYQTNLKVKQMVEEILIQSEKCYVIDRDKLGTIMNFFEEENNLKELLDLPIDVKKNLTSKEITYLSIISSTINGNDIELEISFRSILEGYVSLKISEHFPKDFFDAKPSVLKKRLQTHFKSHLECNELIMRKTALEKEIMDIDYTLEHLASKQNANCEILGEILKNINPREQNKLNRNFPEISGYLARQLTSCTEAKELLKNRSKALHELKKIQKDIDATDLNNIDQTILYQSRLRLEKVKELPANNTNPHDELSAPPQENKADAQTTLLDIGKSIYYENEDQSFKFNKTNIKNLKKQYAGFYFIQFALLPGAGYNAKDFKLFYNIDKERRVYLIDRGASFPDNINLLGLFGPFENKNECLVVLNQIRNLKDYKDAIIFGNRPLSGSF